MVSIHDGGHDHDDGTVCPGCRFREALVKFFDASISDGGEGWHWATGELRHAMHAALLAIDDMEAASYVPDLPGSDGPHSQYVAASIMRIAAEIEELRSVLLNDPPADE